MNWRKVLRRKWTEARPSQAAANSPRKSESFIGVLAERAWFPDFSRDFLKLVIHHSFEETQESGDRDGLEHFTIV